MTINGNDNCVANSPGDCQKTEDDKDPTFWSDLGEIGLASAVGFAIGAAACGDGDPIICTLGELTGGAAIAPVFATAVVLGQIYRDTAGDGKHNPVIEVVKFIGCFVGLC